VVAAARGGLTVFGAHPTDPRLRARAGDRAAIATSLVVVGVTSLAGVVQHARAGNMVWRTGLVFGVAGVAGAYVGGFVETWVPEAMLMVLSP
jgi:uncharacterized membrane protein YfcA